MAQVDLLSETDYHMTKIMKQCVQKHSIILLYPHTPGRVRETVPRYWPVRSELFLLVETHSSLLQLLYVVRYRVKMIGFIAPFLFL